MELSQLKDITLFTGRPGKDMTDERWQTIFQVLKLGVKQSPYRKMSRTYAKSILDSGYYYGDTSYISYCNFINDVLYTIRGNSTHAPTYDYCFFVYQIQDLLRFEYDSLRTRYIKEHECFEVWLEK